MTLERSYSKAKANANHVVWSNQEVFPVTFTLDGVLSDMAEFAIHRVVGRAVFCVGFHAEFRVPARDTRVNVAVNLCNGLGVPAAGGKLYLTDNVTGGDQLFVPPLVMPASSAWKVILQVASPDDTLRPEGITFTYYLRYANGPVANVAATSQVASGGFNFWQPGAPYMSNG